MLRIAFKNISQRWRNFEKLNINNFRYLITRLIFIFTTRRIRVHTYNLFTSYFLFQKTDVTNELVEELQMKTKEFLQPNPTARAKMAAVKGISKLSGQAKASTYPQPEGLLGDCLLQYGKKLGDDSLFGEYIHTDLDYRTLSSSLACTAKKNYKFVNRKWPF